MSETAEFPYAEVYTIDTIPQEFGRAQIGKIWDNPPESLGVSYYRHVAPFSTWYSTPNPRAIEFVGPDKGDGGKGRWVAEIGQRWLDLYGKWGDAVRPSGGAGSGHSFHPKGIDELFINSVLPCAPEPWKLIAGRGELTRPDKLLAELERYKNYGINTSPERIAVDFATPLAWEAHVARDIAQEEARGDKKVGTTKSGVGPAAEDYAGRHILRWKVLTLSDEELRQAVTEEVIRQNRQLKAWGSSQQFRVDETVAQFLKWKEQLGPYVTNTRPSLNENLRNGLLLSEGAQGFAISLDTGWEGAVSSTDSGPGVFSRRYRTSMLRFGWRVGATKFGPTCVGSHIVHAAPPREDQEKLYGRTAERGAPEAGAVSGRKRQYRLYNVPETIAARDTYLLNGQALVKADVFGGVVDRYNIGLDYVLSDGTVTSEYDPDDPRMREDGVKMRVLRVDCWPRVEGLDHWQDAPRELKATVATISHLTQLPVVAIGTGPRYGESIIADGFLERD